MGLWSVIVPEAATNLVTNPSMETNTTGWTAVGGSIARSAAAQFKGTYSLAITPTAGTSDGAYFGTVSLTSGTTYTAAMWFKGVNAIPYQLYFATTGGALLGSAYTFTANGSWQRITVTYAEVSTTTRRIYVTKNSSASTGVFYADAVGCYALDHDTTHVDGDQDGCYWIGTAHGSQSQRTAQVRAGGREYNFDDYATYIGGYGGVGMPPLDNIALPFGQLDGEQYQDTKAKARLFTLNAQIVGTSLANLHSQRKTLINALKPDLVTPVQPLILKYSGANLNVKAQIPAVLDGGLEFNRVSDDGFTELVGMRFAAHDPYWQEEGEEGTSQSGNATLTTPQGIEQRSAAGVWSKLSSGIALSGIVYALVEMPNGDIIASGSFSDAGGVANTSRIARWDGSAWNALGTGASGGDVFALAVDANGNLYAGGSFTSMGGVANTSRIARWDGSAWNALGTGCDGSVRAIAIHPDGKVYLGGDFSTINGVANCTRLGYWNGSTGVAMPNGGGSPAGTGGGANVVRGLAIGKNGNLYVTGGFTAGGSVSAANILRHDGSAYFAMGSGLSGGEGYCLAIGEDGKVYAGGEFTTAGGISCNYLTMWNGAAFSVLGNGLTGGASPVVRALAVDAFGKLWIVGTNITPTGQAFYQAAAFLYFGGHFSPPDSSFNGGSIYSVCVKRNGGVVVGFLSDSVNGAIASAFTITNSGTATAYPRVVLIGPGAVYQLVNYTTKDQLFFNLTLLTGEQAILDLRPGRKSFVSNFRGNLLHTILSWTNIGTWRLMPGSNDLSVYAASGVTCNMAWQKRHWSLDGVA